MRILIAILLIVLAPVLIRASLTVERAVMPPTMAQAEPAPVWTPSPKQAAMFSGAPISTKPIVFGPMPTFEKPTKFAPEPCCCK